jgi:DNA-directed RNA polymerase specialized sigma24 family protein
MPETSRVQANGRRVAAPAVRAKVLAVIGKRVPAGDRDDVAQAAFVRLLLIATLPESDDELLALAVVVTRGQVVDHYRRSAVREARVADGAEVDAIAFDADVAGAHVREEWRGSLAFVEAEVAAGRVEPEILRWARRLAAGDTLAEIAADENIPETTLKNRLRQARVHLRKHWRKYGGGVAAFAALLALALHEEPGEVTAPYPSAWLHQAQEARERATVDCRDGAWHACEEQLDQASRLDPDSEGRPEVKALRGAIDRAIHDSGVPR